MPFETSIKVRGYHLDFYGHMNNARYLEFIEEARWCMVETSVSLDGWKKRGLGFVIVKISINYRKPAVLDDVLRIVSHVAHLGGRSGVIHQDIFRGEGPDAELVADADVTFVVVNTETGKAVALEGDIRESLTE